MISKSRFFEKTIVLESRSFFLQILKFENGYFISVTEGNNKLGSMVVSLSAGPNPITSTIIPSKSESLFLKLIAERISSRIKGMAIVSVFLQKELENKTAKGIMSEIMELVQN